MCTIVYERERENDRNLLINARQRSAGQLPLLFFFGHLLHIMHWPWTRPCVYGNARVYKCIAFVNAKIECVSFGRSLAQLICYARRFAWLVGLLPPYFVNEHFFIEPLISICTTTFMTVSLLLFSANLNLFFFLFALWNHYVNNAFDCLYFYCCCT